jgi:uncharacterized protein
MQIDLDSLGPNGLQFDTTVELEPLPLGGGETVEVLCASIAGEARHGSHGVDFRGTLDGRVRLSCSRCLESVELPIRREFQLILVRDALKLGSGDEESDERASLLFHAEGGTARLDDIVREQIYLQLPLKAVCRPDCQGLCSTCGANRNRLECACPSVELDPRLVPLLELKKKFDRR